ncbi:MAG: hypothetical protein IJW66_01480 [Clostridia bacterium]|nr:hypothetical protein [Clostridia bacterium]
MKKRIISAILVIVMSVMALASCAPAFNFVEDSSAYVTFNYDKFIEALGKIEIEDGDFTTNEDTRKEKVEEDLFSSIASTVIKNALDADKLEVGKIGDKDVVYYCYYATDTKGNVFYFSNMKEASITATSTKADHVIELGSYDKDDELKAKIAAALLNAEADNFDFGTENSKNGYNMLLSSDFATLAERRVSLGDKVVISYKRSYKYTTWKKNSDGTSYVDSEGNPTTDPTKYVEETTATVSEICTFDLVTLSTESTDLIVKHIADALKADADGKAADANYQNKLTANVGSAVTVKEGNETKKEFKIDGALGKDGKIERDDTVKYTYSDVKIEFKIASNLEKDVNYLEVEHTPFDKETKVKPDSLRVDSTAGQIDLKDEKLTYHIFPVYYLSIPEISAESILQYIVAKNITDSYFDVFEEDYKNGDKTVSDLVADIKALFDEKYETGDDASDTHKNLTKLKKAVTDAEAAVKEAGDKALQEQKDAVTDATNAYKKAQRDAISAAVAELAAAKLGEKTLGAELVLEHKDDTYDKLKDEYETHITEAVEKAVYELIFDNDEICKINDNITYPEKLLKEFKEHLYESYEHDFYNGSYSSSSTSKESNYKHYDGNLQEYLYVATGAKDDFGKTESDKEKAIEKAIDAEAKEAIDPLLKLYTVAAALDAKGVSAKVIEYVNKDIAAGAYLARYEDNENLTAKQNKEAKETAEKNAKENEADAKENAGNFLITDEVFKDYKKALGSSAYRSYKEQYGEINIRASLQFNRLFYYLTCTDLVDNTEDNSTDIAYTTPAAGEDAKIAFRTIQYIIVEETEDEEDDHDHNH